MPAVFPGGMHSGLFGGSKDHNFLYADSGQSAQMTLLVLAVTHMDKEVLAAIQLSQPS
jgi:hypothetical protein